MNITFNKKIEKKIHVDTLLFRRKTYEDVKDLMQISQRKMLSPTLNNLQLEFGQERHVMTRKKKLHVDTFLSKEKRIKM